MVSSFIFLQDTFWTYKIHFWTYKIIYLVFCFASIILITIFLKFKIKNFYIVIKQYKKTLLKLFIYNKKKISWISIRIHNFPCTQYNCIILYLKLYT